MAVVMQELGVLCSGLLCMVYKSATGTYVKLLTMKTRVAPLKSLTIPRLELYVSQSPSKACR